MNNNDNSIKGKELLKEDQTSLSKLYKDLNRAINSNNIQSIWELSKTITRYHFRDSEI
ncbi:MAG: hypothetical protein HWN79_11415 [Candidatus Lokiarchaeota archaeon]|nr:hypothetical protein [Candidatus Lokiarchaeota archaeon]